MDYTVKVDLEPPSGSAELDPLQREGVTALLNKWLSAVEFVEGPDGISVSLDEYWVGSQPGGALVCLFMNAPALESAEGAAHQLMEQIIERTEYLSDWQVGKAEVELAEQEASAALAAADAPEAARSHVAAGARYAGADDLAHPLGMSEEEIANVRSSVLNDADKLRAFGLDAFGYDRRAGGFGTELETARLAAGALIYATSLYMDGLFEDIVTLSNETATVHEADGLFILDELPPLYASRYTALFARQFLIAAVNITRRLVQPTWQPPASVAEKLALHLLIEQAKTHLDMYNLLDEDKADHAYNHFADQAFENLDHELLYDPAMNGNSENPHHADRGFSSWFTPFDNNSLPHPYTADHNTETSEKDDPDA